MHRKLGSAGERRAFFGSRQGTDGVRTLIGLGRGLDQAIGRVGGSLPHEDHERGIVRWTRALSSGIVSLAML